MSHDSFRHHPWFLQYNIYGTSLIHVCDITHSCV